jgi:uncharacterized protein involved in type VI secretion and phage assembly
MSLEMEDLVAEMAEDRRSRFFGKYRGLVVDVDDPDKLGRIKAQVPEVLGDTDSPWAIPCVPYAGKSHGLVLLPEVDDGVWIEFEAGDPSRPIWTGCWWGDGELPDPGAPLTRVLATTDGHKLVLDEDANEIHLLHPGGAELKMTDSDITLTIGQAEAKMTSTEVSVKVGQTELKLSLSELSLQCGIGKVKLSASGVELNNGAMKVT